MDMTYTR